MAKPGERDNELADFIKSVIDGEGTWQQKFNKIVEWQKKNRGLKGLHVSAPLDVMCGQRVITDVNQEAENMAHDLCLMEQARAEGQFEEVTDLDL